MLPASLTDLLTPDAVKVCAAFVFITKIALPLLSGLYAHTLRPSKNLRKS